MEKERFFSFTRLIDGIHKSVLRLRLDNAPIFDLKGVHVFWVYELLQHPEGLSAAELAQSSQIDRSLISREITALKKKGYIRLSETEGKRNYNAKLLLTESGKEAAKKIAEIALDFQNRGSEGVSEEDLTTFYKTLKIIHRNLEKIAEENEA